MADASRALVSFNAGEFSQKLWSRLDQAKAGSACRVLENMIVETYGQARRRPGTKFVALSNDSFVSGLPPVGPPGGHWTVNRSVDSSLVPLTEIKSTCLKIITTYTITFISRAGTGCLLGYNEFGTPSDPPRKYRKKNFTGGFTLQIGFGSCTCGQIWNSEAGGSNVYDRLTGVLTQSAAATIMRNPLPLPNCTLSVVYGVATPIESADDCIPFANGAYQACNTVSSPTQINALGGVPGICDQNCYSVAGGEWYTPNGSMTIDLSEEDTFADALVRSGAPTGTAADTLLATQISTFCYTGHSSEWTNVFTGLKIGCSYTFVITYTRGVDVVTETTTFVADSTTETLTGTIPPVLGTTTTAATGTLYVT